MLTVAKEPGSHQAPGMGESLDVVGAGRGGRFGERSGFVGIVRDERVKGHPKHARNRHRRFSPRRAIHTALNLVRVAMGEVRPTVNLQRADSHALSGFSNACS